MSKKNKSVFAAILSFALMQTGSSFMNPPPDALAATAATVTSPFTYDFRSVGILQQAETPDLSTSPYFWLASGGELPITNGTGNTMQGDAPSTNKWRTFYAAANPGQTDNGLHPQNVFQVFTRSAWQNVDQSVQVEINKINLSSSSSRTGWNGVSLYSRYENTQNLYSAGIRVDGAAVIKKEMNGTYYTLASKQIFPGTYNHTTNPNLLPTGKWMGLRSTTQTNTNGTVTITLYLDQTNSGAWTQILQATDDGVKFGGSVLGASSPIGVRTDFMDATFDNYHMVNMSGNTIAPAPTPTPVPVPAPTPTPVPAPSTSYDSAVLADSPVMYLAMNSFAAGSETDKTGNGHNGSYKGGTPQSATLPNGDKAADFNGSSEYLTVPSSAALSITTTRELTWEAWIRPDTLQFPHASGDGYIDWMGKCENYSPTCEWEARMYGSTTAENRPDRLSAYVFKPSAGLGAAADWQPNAGVVQAGHWIHVVGEYQTITTPSGCSTANPGSINIWVNGVKWNQSFHMPTGCMSQFGITPAANNSALNIGTMAFDTWFPGAVGKVAIYNHLLSDSQIAAHFTAMTGITPTGSCSATCDALTL